MLKLLLLAVVAAMVRGQLTGNLKGNIELDMKLSVCTDPGSCVTENTAVTLDHNWRWLHKVGDATNCYTGNLWDKTLCPDPATCTQNCCLDGVDAVDWPGTYGVTSTGSELTLKFVTQGPYSKNIGSRTMLLDSSKSSYYMFKLLNREFTFDVDVSNLPCGLNGALYFVEMEKDGGMASHPTNKAGAAFGTGYCDAQCPHDLKYVSGEANCNEWKPSDNDANAGFGHYGSCCMEMDIWEANSMATAYTPHPCATTGPVRCEGKDCGDNITGERYDGLCDKDGCDLNSWRMGDRTFFGPGANFKVDSTKPMTVVTQFITSDGSDTGELVEIRRLYVQNGQVIQNAVTNVNGVDTTDSITEALCTQSKVVFGDADDFADNGGLKTMGEALGRGMVLIMSLWDDHDANMLWLDSDYPLSGDPATPGISRGPCGRDTGVPADMEANYPNSLVKFSNLKVGTLGSTYPGGMDPPNPNCPGGTIDHCQALCPQQPQAIHDGCIQECDTLCK